jgi:hypothetical protein
MRDPNYAIKVEKAIKEKYGEKAIVNPRADWTDEEEKSYQEQKQIIEKNQFIDNSLEEKNTKCGYLLRNKLFTKEERVCPECKDYSFSIKDGLYFNKFNMCYKCYIKNEWAIRNKKCIINK